MAPKRRLKWEEMVARDKVENVRMVEVPFFVPLGSKAAPEVLAATKEILLQVRRLGLVVKRVHTDCGREFVNKSFRALCADRGLIRTTTGGDNFRSNGRVEALVGRAKNAVRTMLSTSSMSSQSWSFAMRHYVARVQWSVVTQLGGRYPRLPPFGTKVFVKKRSWKMLKEDFVEKMVAARILCPSSDVARGFLVKTEDGSYLTTMVAVENVKEVSGEFAVDAAPAPNAPPGTSRRIRGKTTMAIAKCEQERLCKLDPSGRSISSRMRRWRRPFWMRVIFPQQLWRNFSMACGWRSLQCRIAAESHFRTVHACGPCGGNVSAWRRCGVHQFRASTACVDQVLDPSYASTAP